MSIRIDENTWYSEDDRENETITLVRGWFDWQSAWFCTVTRNGISVVDFDCTKKGAIRKARRAWEKFSDKKRAETLGYPRVVTDGSI